MWKVQHWGEALSKWKVEEMAEVLSGGAMTAAVRPEDVRIGDRDRERATARLGRAQAEGRLDVFEYDDRLRAAYAARTYGELARVTADLPAEPVAGEVPRHRNG